MKVIGINGSPRRNGNTQTLVEEVLKGAAGKGAETRLVNLRELKMNGCLGCEGCKKNDFKCVQKDDLTDLLQELAGYDAIVLGTPVYWFHVTSQFKTFVDRIYSYFKWEEDPETGETKEICGFPTKKKFVIVTTRGDVEDTKILPQYYDYLGKWLKLIARSMRASSVEFVNHYNAAFYKKAAQKNPQILSAAESMGQSLVG